MHKSVQYLVAFGAIAAIAGCDFLPEPDPVEPLPEQRGINVAALLAGDLGANSGPPLNINTYLWAATLETLDFLPLNSTDPFGGVITTDWGTPTGVGSERFRATAFIRSDELSAGALNVAVFRQVNSGAGWVDAPVAATTARQLEDAVLLRARELRRAAAADN